MRKYGIGDYRRVRNFGPEYELVQTDTETADILEGVGIENVDGYSHLFVLVGDGEYLEIWASHMPYLWRNAELMWLNHGWEPWPVWEVGDKTEVGRLRDRGGYEFYESDGDEEHEDEYYMQDAKFHAPEEVLDRILVAKEFAVHLGDDNVASEIWTMGGAYNREATMVWRKD